MPLTPTLSPGERGKGGIVLDLSPLSEGGIVLGLSPLPQGEGQGEGDPQTYPVTASATGGLFSSVNIVFAISRSPITT